MRLSLLLLLLVASVWYCRCYCIDYASLDQDSRSLSLQIGDPCAVWRWSFVLWWFDPHNGHFRRLSCRKFKLILVAVAELAIWCQWCSIHEKRRLVTNARVIVRVVPSGFRFIRFGCWRPTRQRNAGRHGTAVLSKQYTFKCIVSKAWNFNRIKQFKYGNLRWVQLHH